METFRRQRRSHSFAQTVLVLINGAATFEMTMSLNKQNHYDNLFPLHFEKVCK